MADEGKPGPQLGVLVTPLELLRQTSKDEDLITPFELLRQTAGKSPTRPQKREESKKLTGLSALPAPPSPKSSPSGSSSSPPSSPHNGELQAPVPSHALLRRKSDPKTSSPLALSTITCEDAPSPPMSPTSPTKSNDPNSRPSSPPPTKATEMVYLRKVAAERIRKGSRIISFLDTVSHNIPPPERSTPPSPAIGSSSSTGDFLGISRRRTRSVAQPLSSAQWTPEDAAQFKFLSERFERFIAQRQVAPPRIVRQRTRTIGAGSAPVLSGSHGHNRRCSLPLDFNTRAAPEPLSLAESAPAGARLRKSSSESPAPTPPQSPTSASRVKKEKQSKKEKKEKKRQQAAEPTEDIKRPADAPRELGAPLDRVCSMGEPAVFEAADLHSYIATLLAPSSTLTQQAFKDTIDWILLGYRNFATPAELAASIHVIWTFGAGLPPAEAQQQEQNILYLMSRWIALNFESEFTLDNGLPDAVTQKSLTELISRVNDDGQYRFRQMIEDAQREARQLSVFTMPVRRKGKVPTGLKKADLALIALIDISDMARCLTLLDWDMLLKVRRIELLAKAYPHILKAGTMHTLGQVTAKWNAVQTWVTTEIVTVPKIKQRVAILERFIVLAATLLDEQQNYHTFFAVMLGMKDTNVQRMKATWKRLSQSLATLYSKLDRLTDLTGGYRMYRASTKELRRQKFSSIVPFMVVPISDLVMLGNVPDMMPGNNSVNWVKTANVGRVIAEFEDMRRACRKSLQEATWSESDVAIMRMLPQLRLERFELITDDFLFTQSKLHEPSVIL